MFNQHRKAVLQKHEAINMVIIYKTALQKHQSQ